MAARRASHCSKQARTFCALSRGMPVLYHPLLAHAREKLLRAEGCVSWLYPYSAESEPGVCVGHCGHSLSERLVGVRAAAASPACYTPVVHATRMCRCELRFSMEALLPYQRESHFFSLRCLSSCVQTSRLRTSGNTHPFHDAIFYRCNLYFSQPTVPLPAGCHLTFSMELGLNLHLQPNRAADWRHEIGCWTIPVPVLVPRTSAILLR